MITGRQCKAARALLNWTQAELAGKIGIVYLTLADFEQGRTQPHKRNMIDIQKALEDAGIKFIGETGVDLPEKETT